jgi:uncharacterized RDD family membrane protein YckC
VTATRAPAAQPAAVETTAPGYAGLATRTIAFAADAAIINAVAWFVGIVVAVGLSLLGLPKEVRTILAVIGAGIGVIWLIAYFVFFWSTTGQTPGDRMMQIRVQDARTGGPVSVRRALVRLGGVFLSALLLCTGFLLILFDGRRRALQDCLCRTVVVTVPPQPRGGRGRSDSRGAARAAAAAAASQNGGEPG